MAGFTIADNDEVFHADQARWFQSDINALVSGIGGDGVVSGCAVTAQGSPDMTCAVASGTVRIAGTIATVTSGNVTITTADGTNPRIDLVVVGNTGTKSVTAGTAAANPKAPDIPASSVLLAMVYVPAGDTTIASNQITDKRVIVGDALLSAANTFSAKQTVGAGDITTFWGTAVAPSAVELIQGSAASPVTAAGATMRISRTQAVQRATVDANGGGDGSEFLAALAVDNVGTASDQVQPVGVFATAENSGTYTGTGTGNDACGLYAVGRIKGSGVGIAIGAALYARAESTTSRASATEVVAFNYIGSDSAYAPTTFTPISGIWLTAAGNHDSGAGIQIGNAVGRQYEVGIGFSAQVAGGKTGGARVASLRDDGNATTVFDINGTHTDGIDMSGATISGNSLSLPGSVIVSGAGNVGLGAAPLSTSRLYSFYSSAATSGQVSGAAFDAYLNAGAASTATVQGASVSASIHSSATGTYSGATLRGGYFAISNGHATLQLGIAQGFFAYVSSDGAGGMGAARGAEIIMNASAGATIGTASGVLINNAFGAGTVTSQAGVVVDSLAKGTNNTHLLLGTLTIPSGNWGIYSATTNDSVLAGKLGVGAVTAPAAQLHSLVSDAGTNAVVDAVILGHNSSGTPAAGFGTGLQFQGESTTTINRDMATLDASWVVATDASRTTRAVLSVYDTAVREVLRGEASGTAPMIGFLGASAVVRQTVAAAASAGGTGTAAGGYDTAAHRDALITLVNNMRTALINLGLAV